MSYKPFILIVLDGWGLREEQKNNAIAEAETSFFDYLWQNFPHARLDASGNSVGLPQGQIGNSEVGHMTIGAGKVIDTDLVRVSKAIASGNLIKNPVINKLFDHVKKYDSTLHILGLVSQGGVHSHQDHLHALLRAAKIAGLTKVAIHAFTDGRDVPPQSAHQYLKELERVLEDLGIGFIATATGRFYAMDRDKNWERIGKAENAIFNGEGKIFQGQKPSKVMHELHQQDVLDEHLEPLVFLDDKGDYYSVQQNDAIFFFNFRADRARQFSEILVQRAKEMNLLFATLTEYDKDLGSLAAFPPGNIEATLAGEISKAGLRQAHIAETEKYAHATYYLNGGKQDLHQNEEHILIESLKVATHDLAPEMRAKEIADKALEQIGKGVDFVFINFANADMVGHTANHQAVVKAIEEVDHQLKRVVEAALGRGGAAFVTADHGNAEITFDDQTGVRHTAHTTNPVPAIVTVKGLRLRNGNLADITPTVLELLGLPKPNSMTGCSLVVR